MWARGEELGVDWTPHAYIALFSVRVLEESLTKWTGEVVVM